MLDLSIIVLNYNTKQLTINCVKSIYKYKLKVKYDIWVVDNASSDGSSEAIKKQFPRVHCVQNTHNLGYAAGNNLALRQSNGEYCLILNSDTEVLEGSLFNLLNFAKSNGCDICSCKLIYPNGDFQPNAGAIPLPIPIILWLTNLDSISGNIFPADSYQERKPSYYHDREVGWVGGTAMLIKRDVFDKIGYLDDKIFMYGEDVDFCWRAQKAGLKVSWTDKGEIIHIGGASSNKPLYNQWKGEFLGLIYLYKKYYGNVVSWILKLLIYIFIIARILGYFILGKTDYSKTYAKVFTNI